VIMDDSYDNLSPMVDAMRELGPEVCGLLLPTVGYSGIVELLYWSTATLSVRFHRYRP